MPLSPERRQEMIAKGAPTWGGTVAERLFELAVLANPQEMYENALQDQTGFSRNPRAFRYLLQSGMLQHTDERNGACLFVEVTAEGAELALDAITERIESLEATKSGLLVVRQGLPEA